MPKLLVHKALGVGKVQGALWALHSDSPVIIQLQDLANKAAAHLLRGMVKHKIAQDKHTTPV